MLLSIYIKELKSTQKPTHKFYRAIFIIAKTSKQPWCHSIGEWKNYGTSRQGNIFQWKKKKWAIKLQKAWMNFKRILLSERSQSEKASYCMVPTIWHSGKGKTIKPLKRSVVSRGWGKGEMNMQSRESF